MASNRVPIAVAHGEGIGPETMAASLHMMEQAGIRIETETIKIGERLYGRAIAAGLEHRATGEVYHKGFAARHGR